jgi:hypothetical protein
MMHPTTRALLEDFARKYNAHIAKLRKVTPRRLTLPANNGDLLLACATLANLARNMAVEDSNWRDTLLAELPPIDCRVFTDAVDDAIVAADEVASYYDEF